MDFVICYVNSSSCRYDYLAVHDGSSISSPIIGSKLCGSIPADKKIMNATGNVINLHFVSDNSETKTGFKIHADAITGNFEIIILYFQWNKLTLNLINQKTSHLNLI